VARYQGNYKVKTFTCRDQYYAMAFAQLTYRESLRDIEACLRAQKSKLHHMGIQSGISRTTLAKANERRDWRIYADFAQSLIPVARKLYVDEDLGLDLDNTIYALDSTTIDLCLSVFPWAHFRTAKAAVKLHTLLDLRGNIPTFIHISDGKLHDVNVLDILIPEPGSFYVMDRGYVDFGRLFELSQCMAFFVTRAKSNLQFRRLYSHPVDKTTGLRCDQTIVLTGFYSQKDYPAKLRRIKYRDAETGKVFVFLTNNFSLPALTIAKLYRHRWKVELFFKWIKQHLRIKSFFGTTENAVKTQVWIAVSVYVLVAILKKRLNLDASLYTILQILSVTIFERMTLYQALTDQAIRTESCDMRKQLNLFGKTSGQ
jgi:transposase